MAGVENVTRVMNETAVTMHSALSGRSNDVVIQGKIKAQFIDARDLLSNAFYVVVERGQVFLMGRVTEREANRATEIARQVSGVKKVVRVLRDHQRGRTRQAGAEKVLICWIRGV